MNFKNETELYAKIDELKAQIKADKINEHYHTSCSSGWYINQKDYRGNEIQYSFVRSLLLTFLDSQGLVIYNAMAIIRCNKGYYSYELVANKID